MKKKYDREKILKECNDLITVKQFKRYIKKLRNSKKSRTQKGGDIGTSGSIGTLISDVGALIPGTIDVIDEITDLFNYVSNDVNLNAGTTYTSGTFSGLN